MTKTFSSHLVKKLLAAITIIECNNSIILFIFLTTYSSSVTSTTKIK